MDAVAPTIDDAIPAPRAVIWPNALADAAPSLAMADPAALAWPLNDARPALAVADAGAITSIIDANCVMVAPITIKLATEDWALVANAVIEAPAIVNIAGNVPRLAVNNDSDAGNI